MKAVKGKKEAWLNVLKANDEDSKERCLELYKEEKRNTKRCIRRRKQEVNEQFGRRMNEDIQGNRKLFWKEARKVKNENKGNLLRIMNRDGAFVTHEMDVRGVWKEHFENLHNINSNEAVSYTHLRAHETPEHLVCRLLLEKKKKKKQK